jgi:hypothetical protein
VVVNRHRHVRVHGGHARVAAAARELAAHAGAQAQAFFALGDQARDQGTGVPFGAVGGPLPVGVGEPPQQRDRRLAFGVADLGGRASAGPRQARGRG